MRRQKMKIITLFNLLVLCVSSVLAQGPVILGGDDLTDHGSVVAGVPQNGWKYIQLALENIIVNVSRSGNDGSVAALGAAPSTAISGNAGAAIGVAASAAGLSVTYYDGAAAINNFFVDLVNGITNPAIIWLAGTGAANNLVFSEGAALTANAVEIANFVNSGGGLMSHGTGSVAYGWLFALLPGLNDVASGSFGDLVLTAAGQTALPTLTNAQINTGPWHNHFEGDFGDLKVLVKSGNRTDSKGDSAAVIIGGAEVSLPGQIELTPTVATNPVGTNHTVTAFVKEGKDPFAPIPNVSVTFKLISGPNIGDMGTDMTDASGTAEFVYAGDGGAGTDEIQAWFVDPATMDTVFSNIVTKTWTGDSLRCNVTITSPQNGAIVCDDSLKVTGVTTIAGGFPPFTIQCDVNGLAAAVTDTMFMAQVPLVSRNNTLIATCTITDSLGNQTVCADTIEVFLDDKPPTCSFTADASGVSGTFFDGRSGIAAIIPVKIKNGVLTVEAFTPGDKRVDFHIEVTDPNKKMSFNIEVTDACGNRFVCDPVFLNLTTSGSRRQFEFTFPSRDRYFQVTNHGLSEIRADLNGRKFTLLADAKQAEQRTNAYVMPLEGSIKIDMNPYLQPNENSMFLTFEGTVGTNAELFISDFGDHVDYTLDLQAIPDKFDLAQNFPNPFNPTTNIRFDVPDQLANGVRVQLRIYNLLGELVRTLMDEQKLPGQYVAEWNGRNDRDESVSSGIYIYQLVAGKVRATKRMLLLR